MCVCVLGCVLRREYEYSWVRLFVHVGFMTYQNISYTLFYNTSVNLLNSILFFLKKKQQLFIQVSKNVGKQIYARGDTSVKMYSVLLISKNLTVDLVINIELYWMDIMADLKVGSFKEIVN